MSDIDDDLDEIETAARHSGETWRIRTGIKAALARGKNAPRWKRIIAHAGARKRKRRITLAAGKL